MSLQRCIKLHEDLSLSTVTDQPIPLTSTSISPAAKVISRSPHPIRTSMSTTTASATTLVECSEPRASLDSSSPVLSTSVSPGPVAETQLIVTSGDPDVPGQFAPVAPLSINWTTFLESSSPHPQTFVEELPIHRPAPVDGNPLLYMPSAYRGVQELWALTTSDADPNFVGGVAADSSVLLPFDVMSFQACCKIFELLVFESGCFAKQLGVQQRTVSMHDDEDEISTLHK